MGKRRINFGLRAGGRRHHKMNDLTGSLRRFDSVMLRSGNSKYPATRHKMVPVGEIPTRPQFRSDSPKADLRRAAVAETVRSVFQS